MEDFLSVLVFTYSIMVLAEFGDKTNLIALSLMSQSKYPFRIALYSTVGIGLSTIISVLIGSLLGENLPLEPIRYVTAIIFIFLGVSILFEDEHEEEEENQKVVNGENSNNQEIDVINPVENIPFYKPIYLVALAEFGDKSQLFAISASASTTPLAVFIGATLGMGTIMFATAALGSVFFEKIDAELMEKIAAALFIIAGLWIGLSTLF